MARRIKQQQSKHDARVRKDAEAFKRQGYDVKADVSGFAQPGTIGGLRPDIVATKGSEKIIEEVETRDSVDSAWDQKQAEAFQAAADRSKTTRFVRKIVK